MKKTLSFFLSILFLITLIADGLLYHHHDIISHNFTSYQKYEECEKCLFSNCNSNSFSSFDIKSNSFEYLVDLYPNRLNSENYFKSIYNKIYQRGPPA